MDELLADLDRSGWLVNNCYQRSNGIFRVSLRRPTPTGDWFSEWAEGETMADAFTECMSKLLDAEFKLDEPITHAMEPNKSLISLLGLIHAPLAPIKRRF
jgi:hypothetical protein